MSSQRYGPEFKDESGRQVGHRGYSIGEVADGLGVSTHSWYEYVNSHREFASTRGCKSLFRIAPSKINVCCA